MLLTGRPPPAIQPGTTSIVRTLVDGILAVVVAPVCAACASPLACPTRSAVCGACWSSIHPLPPPFCAVCGDPLGAVGAGEAPRDSRAGIDPGGRCAGCRESASAIARTRSIGAYDEALRAMLHALKYQGRRSIASELSALMRLHGQAVLAGADFVVPVPLHWRRRWRRGFNQAADLARALGLPVRQVLCRCRRTLPQADLPAGQRHLNVRRAFRVRHPSLVANASIVLIDGRTLSGVTRRTDARVGPG
jgi:predicted amidophosphoribosyltransferase